MDDGIRIIDLTVGQLKELIRAEVSSTMISQQNEFAEEPDVIYGDIAIAEALGRSVRSLAYWDKTGALEPFKRAKAIWREGKHRVGDRKKIMEVRKTLA